MARTQSGDGRLHHRAALLYYSFGMTQSEIAELLGLSRVKVTRLLAQARQEGVVEIKLHTDIEAFPDEVRTLSSAFSLRRVWVAPTSGERSTDDARFAAVADEALKELVAPGMVVAVGGSNTLSLVAAGLAPRLSKAEAFIPFQGSALGQAAEASGVSVASTFASKLGSSSLMLPAPQIAESAEAAEISHRDPGVEQALGRARSAQLLLAGIGAFTDEAGVLRKLMRSTEYEELEGRGAVGDIGARFYDADGAPVEGGFDRRTIGLSLEAIRQVPERVLFARGSHKLDALRVALRTGIASSLVTDAATARALVNQGDEN